MKKWDLAKVEKVKVKSFLPCERPEIRTEKATPSTTRRFAFAMYLSATSTAKAQRPVSVLASYRPGGSLRALD